MADHNRLQRGSTAESETLIFNDGSTVDSTSGTVVPNTEGTPESTLKHHMDLSRSMVHAPPEGRRLYFEDNKRRVDFVLVWRRGQTDPEHGIENKQIRQVFERNLEEEGLELEHDVMEEREVQCTMVHAPFEVLSRYGEIMKLKVPIKELPEKVKTEGVWEMMTGYLTHVVSPFELDPTKVPPLPKRFTYVYERDKEYLYHMPHKKDLLFSHATRSRVVDYILRRKKYTDDFNESFDFGINQLLSNQVYEAAYPLHEGSWKPWTKPSMRRLLYENWAHWKNFYKVQPLDFIRVYLGEKIGLYFAWLGYYTYMLIPASVVGLIVFIYGIATINTNIVAQESCNTSVPLLMCPMCYRRCPYWNYSATCTDNRASQMFDNGATVFFACFMSLWGTFFLEFWKREQAGIQFKWTLTNFEAEEEPPRPEYLVRLANSSYKKCHKITGQEEPYMPFWRRQVPKYFTSFIVMLFLVLLAISCVIGVIVYRMAIRTALYLQDEEILYNNASMVTAATAALINLVIIFILSLVYSRIAEKLTDWECLRTQTEHDSSLAFKLYLLQFVNYYSSIFYIAFFKGRFTGRPGDYNELFGARQEECQGSGCLMELCIQLSITFVGKQLIKNNLMEIFLPKLKRAVASCCCRKSESEVPRKQRPWEKDYKLEELGSKGLFNEYLEMLIQFGFVTLFVAAFPLAPLFALINNIIEIRADANKFVAQYRRPIADRTQDIGIWYNVLYGVSRIAILTNAFIIASTSSFINRLVYTTSYSEDGSLNGYVDNSLSYFNVSDFSPELKYVDTEGRFNHVVFCRYKDYRVAPWEDNKYEFSTQHWHVIAAQFIFVVVFENVIVLLTSLLSWLIPDLPRKLGEQMRREAYLTNEIIVRTELERAQGRTGPISERTMERLRQRVYERDEETDATRRRASGGSKGDRRSSGGPTERRSSGNVVAAERGSAIGGGDRRVSGTGNGVSDTVRAKTGEGRHRRRSNERNSAEVAHL